MYTRYIYAVYINPYKTWILYEFINISLIYKTYI